MSSDDAPGRIDLRPVMQVGLGQQVGQLRAAPVQLGAGEPKAVVAAYCADFDVDPYIEMFFFPGDTLKLALIAEDGQILWRRDLGRGVVPGMWFCPVLPFDLDGDGVDEIWFVNNLDPDHPLGVSHYCLERVDARTGKTTQEATARRRRCRTARRLSARPAHARATATETVCRRTPRTGAAS